MHRSHNAGFSLLELSIVLAIMGVLTAGGLVAGAIMIEKKSIVDTKALVEQAKESLTDYYKVNGRLPCVASMQDDPGTANFGVELDEWASDTCFNGVTPPAGTWEVDNGSGEFIRIGMLPVRTLGLNDSAARDHFNSRLMYAVTERLTDDGDFGAAPGAITVLDNEDNTILNDAAFVVLSHGKDKKGAYQFHTGNQVVTCGSSNNLDVVNCTIDSSTADDRRFRDASYNDGELEDYFFDDLVAWVPKFHLMGERTVSSSLWAVGTGNNIYSVGVDENTNTTNVGIGTDDPDNKLQVEGITAAKAFRNSSAYGRYADLAELYGETAGDELIIGTVGSGSAEHEIVFMNADNNNGIPDDGINFVNYGTSGPENALHITGGSRVGIGNTNPSERLHVNGNIQGSNSFLGIGGHGSNYLHLSHPNYKGAGEYALLQHRSAGHLYLNSVGTGNMYFRNDNASNMTILSNGRVGIGTTSPARKLHLNGDRMRLTGSAGNLELWHGTSHGTIRTVGATKLTLGTNNAERMHIMPNGFIGIGTSNPKARLHVHGAGRLHSGNKLPGTSYPPGSQNNAFGLIVRAPGSDDGGILISVGDNNNDEKAIDIWNEADNQQVFTVRSRGSIFSPRTYATTTSNASNMYVHTNGLFYRSTSSARYKKNIEDYTGGLEKLHRIRPVTYEEKDADDGARYAGFIAEEMDAAGLTEFVNYDEQDRPDALQYGHITALLAKAVQELDAKVKTLETANAELAQKNDELENRLAALEAKLAAGWQAEPAPSGQMEPRKSHVPLLVIIAFLLGAVLMLLFKPRKTL